LNEWLAWVKDSTFFVWFVCLMWSENYTSININTHKIKNIKTKFVNTFKNIQKLRFLSFILGTNLATISINNNTMHNKKQHERDDNNFGSQLLKSQIETLWRLIINWSGKFLVWQYLLKRLQTYRRQIPNLYTLFPSQWWWMESSVNSTWTGCWRVFKEAHASLSWVQTNNRLIEQKPLKFKSSFQRSESALPKKVNKKSDSLGAS
jgi:hypothetical protein